MLKRVFIFLTLTFILFASPWYHFFYQNPKIKILAFDGGGVRGIASLELLAKMQSETKTSFHQKFDVFAGTSTGSIIAIFLALGRDVDQLLEDYKSLSAQVFKHPHLELFHPKYKQAALKESLIKMLHSMGLEEDALLNQLPKKVVIPTVLLNTSKLFIIENITEQGGKTKIIDAILDSTAAPVYFPAYEGHVDGGIGMNDPSLAAILCSFEWAKKNLNNIFLLSLGTGREKTGIQENENWGALHWFLNLFDKKESPTPLLSLLMNVEGQIPSQVCAKLLGTSYKRINFPLDHVFKLDDYKDIPKLTAAVDQFIQAHPAKLSESYAWIEKNIR